MFLENINSPADLAELPDAAIPALADEIRDFLISSVEKCGGHLASNLGVVELTLALHRNFDCPKDKFIFDVGHQSYVHKIITGRKDGFSKLRTEDGISGFTKRAESEYDAFGAGHSSTSISSALGFARAAKLSGDDSWAVAVVGDGAFTGGMIYEALNNCEKDLHLMVILNDNEMSISKNVGKMSKYISDIRSSKYYIRLKHDVTDTLNALPVVGKSAFGTIAKIKESVRKLAVYDSNFFENMGLRYFGPVDGNDYEKVNMMIREAKSHGKSCIIHVTTKKGFGYPPAQIDPRHYHAVSPSLAQKSSLPSFSVSFGKALTRLAKFDEDVCAVTAAMCDGTGLTEFSEKYPERFFDVGIAEEHAVTFSAGLSAAGKKPVFAVYSSFLQRAYDNLIHDVASQDIPLVLGIDRSGLSPDDGTTHHGIYDVAFLSQIPHTTVLAPISTKSLEPMLAYALSKNEGITAIRYPKGSEDEALAKAFYHSDGDFKKIGIKTAFSKDGSLKHCKYVFISYGLAAAEAVEAAEKLNGIEKDSAGVILLEIVSQKDFITEKIANTVSPDAKLLFTEEGIYSGGAGMILKTELSDKYGIQMKVKAIKEVPDRANSRKSFYKKLGIDSETILKEITE